MTADPRARAQVRGLRMGETMATNSSCYRATNHIYGLEYHAGRLQPWTVWVEGRTAWFARSYYEAVRAFQRICGEWSCSGCKSIGGITHEAGKE